MTFFQRLFFMALLAGVVGGFVAAALHISMNVPMILQAEVFEHTAHHAEAGGVTANHEHPEVSLVERNLLTLTVMILAYVGYALLICVLAEVSGGLKSWRSGLLWGMGGYLAVSFVPALGLPPELPGMPAADLLDRQLWWLSCAGCTAAALLLVANFRSIAAYIASAVAIAAPFVFGAPSAPNAETLVPLGLHHSFVAGSLAAGLMTWLAVGLALGLLRAQIPPASETR